MKVTEDEFEGMGLSFEKEMEEKLGNTAMAEAMKIIANPGLHAPPPKTKRTAKIFSRTYDLSSDSGRAEYEKAVSDILNCQDGSILLLDRPPKQFVHDADGTYRYVAYLEWAKYVERPIHAPKTGRNKNLAQTTP